MLLKHVQDEQDIYIITEDSDYYSSIDKSQVNGFLRDEWRKQKKSDVYCYKSVSGFLKDHYDGVLLSFDLQKKALIDELENTGSFAATHAVVAKLEDYKYFSLQETIALLDAAIANSQLEWIITDPDVKSLMLRATTPNKSKLNDEKYKSIIEKIFHEDE